MITHLQRDLGVRYNPACKPENAKFQPADSFLYGILHGKGGTCGSLPVLYTAVGRRLGYPIRLVTTKNHLFCRWLTLKERFNIEASGEGISFFPDDYFRTGRFAMPVPTIVMCGYLKVLTPREEVAGFMLQRGMLDARKKYLEATTSFAWANELDPQRWQHMFLTGQAMNKWDGAIRPHVPQGFPKLEISPRERRFQQMPENAEAAFVRLLFAQSSE